MSLKKYQKNRNEQPDVQDKQPKNQRPFVSKAMREEARKACEVLEKGGIILYPTDTIWGIGCDATNPEAVKRVFELKQRADNKAMLVLIDNEVKLNFYVKDVPEFAFRTHVKAGLTGYAQVYGKYNTTPYDKLQMDLMYINKMSISEDIRLIFATLRILFMPDSTAGINEGSTTALTEKAPDAETKTDENTGTSINK